MYTSFMTTAHPDNTGRSKFFVVVYRRTDRSKKFLYAVRAFVPELNDQTNKDIACAAIRADGRNIVGTRHLNPEEVRRVEAGELLFRDGEEWL